jgi:uncharacterized membrane protein YphA (DoxX/SURF4 family)
LLKKLARSIPLLLILVACASPAQAHEKWFYPEVPEHAHITTALSFPWIIGLLVASAITAGAGFWWRARGQRDLIPGPQALGATPERRARFYSLVPLILGIHVGVPLIVLGISGQLFSPNNHLAGPWSYALGVSEIGIGLSLLYGGLTRVAAAALALLWLIGVPVAGLEPMLENLQYLGFAAFFYFTGRGPYAIDRLLFPAIEPPRNYSLRAMPSLRIGVALSLSVVAFTEKLANPQLSLAFLQRYNLNFTPWLGIPMSDRTFVLCAGTSELAIGLLLVFGYFPRSVIATVWVLINMTLVVFNWVELVGHLPIYGAMAVLLIWTPDLEEQRLWIQGVLVDRGRVD